MSGREAAAFYTRYAGLYDRIATDAPFVSELRERVVDALDPGRGDVVVEMGCGTGANLRYLRDRVGRGGTVVGIDVSAGAIERAQSRVERNGWRNVHVLRGDATRPPLGAVADPGGVDHVLSTFLTGMLSDPAGAVDDWCRLVASGGRSDPMVGGESRVCVAGFARSTHALGRLLNPAFAGAVRLAAPPTGDPTVSGKGEVPRESPVARLDRRALAAHGRVHDRCADASTTRLLAGFVRVTAGTVTPESGKRARDHDTRT